MPARYSGLKLQQIVQQLNIDQFSRLCSLVDEQVKKGVCFNVLSIKPFRDSQDICRLAVDVMIDGSNEVKTFEVLERV